MAKTLILIHNVAVVSVCLVGCFLLLFLILCASLRACRRVPVARHTVTMKLRELECKAWGVSTCRLAEVNPFWFVSSSVWRYLRPLFYLQILIWHLSFNFLPWRWAVWVALVLTTNLQEKCSCCPDVMPTKGSTDQNPDKVEQNAF